MKKPIIERRPGGNLAMYQPHIKTKFLAATCFKGSRIKVTCPGHPSKTYHLDHSLNDPHLEAAQNYLHEIVSESLRITSYTDSEDGKGYLFLFSRREA